MGIEASLKGDFGLASPVCSDCESTAFEIIEACGPGNRSSSYVVRCASCGIQVGIVEPENVAANIDELEEYLRRIELYQIGLKERFDKAEFSLQ